MDQDSFESRIFENFDYLRDKIDNLCTTTGEIKKEHALLKQSVDNHLKESDKKAMTNGERIKWAMGIAAGLIVVKLSEFL